MADDADKSSAGKILREMALRATRSWRLLVRYGATSE